MLDLETGESTTLPPVPGENLRGHSCGYVEELNAVVVAGGFKVETASAVFDLSMCNCNPYQSQHVAMSLLF